MKDYRTYPEASNGLRQARAQYVKTGEYRAPKKGEHYLSGAIPEVYEAPNDLGSEYHIMRASLVQR